MQMDTSTLNVIDLCEFLLCLDSGLCYNTIIKKISELSPLLGYSSLLLIQENNLESSLTYSFKGVWMAKPFHFRAVKLFELKRNKTSEITLSNQQQRRITKWWS